MVDREGGCMRGCEKIQLLGEQSVLKILGSTFMEVIQIYLLCRMCLCVCPCKKMVASKKNGVCVQKKHVCIEKKGVCTGKKSVCVRYPLPDHRHFPKGQFCLLAFLSLDRSFVSSMSPTLNPPNLFHQMLPIIIISPHSLSTI